MKSLEELGISPAPWDISDDPTSFPEYAKNVKCDFWTVAKYCRNADARLVAAAPELYKCLQTLWAYYDHENWGETLEGRIKAALEKAGGKNEQR